MTDRVPAAQLDWQLLAEERIRAAQADGRFDSLPGFGRPIPGIDEPHDELWWVKSKLRDEGLSVLPPALEIGLDVERTLIRIRGLESEWLVRQEVTALNARIRKAGLAAMGPSVNVLPLEADDIVVRWRLARQGLREQV